MKWITSQIGAELSDPQGFRMFHPVYEPYTNSNLDL
jgi:hypothetical protein